MSNEKKEQVGRLAMRREGNQWVAYYAKMGTMEGAIWLGAIRMEIVVDPRRKQQFFKLMRDAAADIIEESTGTRPTWGVIIDAPEHERAGRA